MSLVRLALIQRSSVCRWRDSRSNSPIGFAFSTGNLSDCRKIYFDEQRDTYPRYRIIYEEETYRQVGRALERLVERG